MLKKQLRRVKRHYGIRKRIIGTEERPRLCIKRSLKHLYAQIIDDTKGITLYSFSTMDKAFQAGMKKAPKKEASKQLGEFFAGKMKEKGITKIAFDRAGFKYHGRIQALADALRAGGVDF